MTLETFRDLSDQIVLGLNDFEVLIIVVVAVIISILLWLSKSRIINLFQMLQTPKVEVISHNLKPTVERSDSVVYLDIRVYNHGGPGAITVWVELLQGKNAWKRSLRFHLEPKQTQDITFRISETGLSIADKVDYRIWID